MGAWGHKAFENDTAMDWVDGLKKAKSVNVLRKPLKKIIEMSKIKTFGITIYATDEEEAVAAAEVIALTIKDDLKGVPTSVKDFIERQRDNINCELISLAFEVIKFIANGSGLSETWKASKHYKKWKSYMSRLSRRLAAMFIIFKCEERQKK